MLLLTMTLSIMLLLSAGAKFNAAYHARKVGEFRYDAIVGLLQLIAGSYFFIAAIGYPITHPL